LGLILVQVLCWRPLLLTAESLYLPLNLIRHEVLRREHGKVLSSFLVRLGTLVHAADESFAILQSLRRWRLERLSPLADNTATTVFLLCAPEHWMLHLRLGEGHLQL
jgi:hypothetical protein